MGVGGGLGRPDHQPTHGRELTVGVYTCGDAEGLRRSLPTVLGQTWQGPLRLVVVDDCTDDAVVAVLEELGSVHGPVDVIRQSQRRGRSRAWNEVIERAGQGYLTWIEAGDLWHPQKLARQFARLDALGRARSRLVVCATPLRRVWLRTGDVRVDTPRPTDQQVHGALLGELDPYVVTLLGPAEAFRAPGGFDERLPCRQDRGFLLRLLAAGGHVAVAASDPALYTRVEAEETPSAAQLALANRLIRHETGALGHRYGRRLAWRLRARHCAEVAAAHQRESRSLRAGAHRAQAVALHALAGGSWGSLLRGTRQLAHRGRRAVSELRPGRRVRPPTGRVLPGPQAPGSDGRRRDRDGPNGSVSPIERARRALDTGDHQLAVDLLLPLARDRATSLPPRGWWTLISAYRELDLDAARRTAQRALEVHPDDLGLGQRMIEVHYLRQEWDECMRAWSALTPSERRRCRPITYVRVARAAEQLGELDQARQIAEEGATVSAGYEQLREVLYRLRAQTLDWAASVRVLRSSPPRTADEVAVGGVEDLGFLAGGKGPIRGWVEVTDREAPTVSLLVNGTVVATTQATRLAGSGRGQAHAFSLACHDLRRYLGDGDVVSLRSQGGPIALGDDGVAVALETGYPSRADDLVERIRAGQVFTRFGQLRQSYTPEDEHSLLDLFETLAAGIEASHGHRSYPLYGNLLGAVREHDFIRHDVGGFDMGYVSRLVEPADIRQEFADVCRMLLGHGYHLTIFPWSAIVRRRPADQLFADVHFGWFSADGELELSYGWRHDPVTDVRRLHIRRTSLMAGRIVPVPGNAEAVLEQIYGPGWVVPDQGFGLPAELRREGSCLLGVAEMEAIRTHRPDRVRVRPLRPADAEGIRPDALPRLLRG